MLQYAAGHRRKLPPITITSPYIYISTAYLTKLDLYLRGQIEPGHSPWQPIVDALLQLFRHLGLKDHRTLYGITPVLIYVGSPPEQFTQFRNIYNEDIIQAVP